MTVKIACREAEIAILGELFQSKNPEFLAVCGRRRIGKTFLIKEYFSSKKDGVFFTVTGSEDAPMREQIENFTDALSEIFYQGAKLQQGKNWKEAFASLTQALSMIPKDKRIILFFDEFPWLFTKNSRLLQTLSYYWNQYWSNDSRIKLIVCGSASSWIIRKIIQNKGGLHNRVTREIYLEPFNLRDTQRYLSHRGIRLNQQHILTIYMAIGGVAHYLNKVEKGLSSAEVIERLAFHKKSFLLDEFDKLYASLFKEHQVYIDIVRAIAQHHYGVAQEDLFRMLDHLPKGESSLQKLEDLKKNGFIISFTPYSKEKGIYYKVVDEFTLFYFHWIESIKGTLLTKGIRKKYWESVMKTPAWNSWSGYAFETICYKHISQISRALDLSPSAIPNTWRIQATKGVKGAQIDLLFDRNDNAITICEIKYTGAPFLIDKSYAQVLQRKMEVFKQHTKTKKQLFLVIISSQGLKKSMYSEEMVDKLVTLNNLFEKEE